MLIRGSVSFALSAPYLCLTIGATAAARTTATAGEATAQAAAVAAIRAAAATAGRKLPLFVPRDKMVSSAITALSPEAANGSSSSTCSTGHRSAVVAAVAASPVSSPQGPFSAFVRPCTSSGKPSSLLQRVGFIDKQAHARSSSCCCCSDTHVFVGGSGLVGTVCVWRIVSQQQKEQCQKEQQQEQEGLEFVGLLGRMSSQIMKLSLNHQGDTLLALTQSGLCYVWQVDHESLLSLQTLTGTALSLAPTAAAAAAAAAWRSSRSSSLYNRRDSFFSSPVGDDLLQHGMYEASQVYIHLLLNSPSPRCILGAEGRGFVTLSAPGVSINNSTSSIGDDLQAVEFLQDGRLVVASASCPSAYPLVIYETQRGHLLAAFAATAVLIPRKPSSSNSSSRGEGTGVLLCSFPALALDRYRPPFAAAAPAGAPGETAATAAGAAKGRWLAAASDVGGCLAMAFIGDEKLAELQRHFDSTNKQQQQHKAAAAAAATESVPVSPQVLPLQAFYIGERAATALSLVWRPRRRALPRSSNSSSSIHLLLGCSDGFIRVCAFLTQAPRQLQQQQQQLIQVYPQLRLKSVTLARIANGMQKASICDLLYVHLSHKRAVLMASCNATDLPSDSSGVFSAAGAAAAGTNGGSSNSSNNSISSTNWGFYDIRVAEQTEEGIETVTEVLQRHSEFIVGLAASQTASTIVSLSADGHLVVHARKDALAAATATGASTAAATSVPVAATLPDPTTEAADHQQQQQVAAYAAPPSSDPAAEAGTITTAETAGAETAVTRDSSVFDALGDRPKKRQHLGEEEEHAAAAGELAAPIDAAASGGAGVAADATNSVHYSPEAAPAQTGGAAVETADAAAEEDATHEALFD